MRLVPYLYFNGNCEEALEAYRKAFGGETSIMRYEDMPADPNMPVGEAWKKKIMHASLVFGDGLTIYLSDTFEGGTVRAGDNSSIHVEVDSEEEVHRLFQALADGAQISMPVDRVFWGSVYGSLVDRFGVSWGFEYQIPA